MTKKKEVMACAVAGCKEIAKFAVFQYDRYPGGHEVNEHDTTCPYLCAAHKQENEDRKRGTPSIRSFTDYPFSNRRSAAGYTIYKDLAKQA